MKLYGRINGVFKVCPLKKNKPIDLPGATSYYVRCVDPVTGKPKNQPVGQNFQDALVEFLNMQQREVSGEPEPTSTDPVNVTIAAKIDEFIETRKSEWRPSSHAAYSRSLALFLESTSKTLLSKIDAHDLDLFKNHLRDKYQHSDRTIVNKFENVMEWLKWAKVKLEDVRWPDYDEREVEAYSDEEIELFRSTATGDAALMIDCFLFSGLRDQELAHLTYGDVIAPSHFRVKSKDGWKTKTKNSARLVPIPPELRDALWARQQANDRRDTDLVFFNRYGQPHQHFLRITQGIATEAGITGRVDNHKFRATAITLWLRDGRTIQDVMLWVGHTSPTIVMRYAAKLKVMSEETVELASKAFRKFLAPKVVETKTRRIA